ncbi:hypothetical protein [Micromonospora fulviviridis]|uniref:hypothetical protein n=1 Tax=Micromonospora fulviviridis TaxID=47860 RepID=UPI001665CF69|nr:hypothetical protein [Micromonospora fulviviridis]
MNQFWSGVLSGLIGAIVGGIFSAFGAWIQARSTRDSTLLQLEHSRAADADAVRRQHLQTTCLTIMTALQESHDLLWNEIESHEDQPKHDLEVAWLVVVRVQRKLFHVKAVWGGLLPDAEAESLYRADYELSVSKSAFFDKANQGGGEFSDCGFCQVLTEFAECVSDALTTVQKLHKSTVPGG